MFSGIVEEFATVRKLVREQGNLHLTLTCSFVNEWKIDQSVAHNGVCLTGVDITGDEKSDLVVMGIDEAGNLDHFQIYTNKGGDIECIEEKDLTGDRLLEEINKLINDKSKLKEIGDNAKKMATLNAKEQIADIVLGLIK